MPFSIPKQTEAEQDQYLIDCFYDTGIIKELIEDRYSIISGRKGSGKTAIARYLEQEYEKYGIDYSFRFSLSDLAYRTDSESKVDDMLFFVLTKSIQKLLSRDLLNSDGKYQDYWKDFLLQNGLQDVTDYHSFQAWNKTNEGKFKLGPVNAGVEREYKKFNISNSVSNLFSSLLSSVESAKIFIFIDDISEHLDSGNKAVILEDINMIRDFIYRLSNFDTQLLDAKKELRFICCIRDDLFGFMEGSNINKLRNNTLDIRWDEKDFCGLIIRRLPFYEDNLEEHLKDPINAVKKQFPNEIFKNILGEIDTKHYQTNFYAYMVAISFNRPRDFLKFCYAMRLRLSQNRPAVWENIDSAEGEYADYFIAELKDEFYLASKVFDFESSEESTHKLIDLLCRSEEFNFGQLRTDIASYLDVKTTTGSKKIMEFIYELWWYGVIGFKEEKDSLINYRYIKGSANLMAEKVKEYAFYLHRGISWFIRKRRNNKKINFAK